MTDAVGDQAPAITGWEGATDAHDGLAPAMTVKKVRDRRPGGCDDRKGARHAGDCDGGQGRHGGCTRVLVSRPVEPVA
jgi:hypothetical protein